MYKYRPYKIDEYGSPTFADLLCVQSKGYFLFSSIYGESLSKIFFRLSCMEEEGWVIEKTGVADEYEEAQDLSSQDLLEEALTSRPSEELILPQNKVKQRIKNSVVVENDQILYALIRFENFADFFSNPSHTSPSRQKLAQAGAFAIKSMLKQPSSSNKS